MRDRWISRGLASLLIALYIVSFVRFLSAVISRGTWLLRPLGTGLITGSGSIWVLVQSTRGNADFGLDLLLPVTVGLLTSIPFHSKH